MSRQNKRRRGWKCAGCGAGMWRELRAKAQRVSEMRGVKNPVVHVCGGCGTMHLEEGDGLRRLTPAEKFALRCETPEATELATAMRLSATSSKPSGVLILGDK